jgi:hypothetical protein
MIGRQKTRFIAQRKRISHQEGQKGLKTGLLPHFQAIFENLVLN